MERHTDTMFFTSSRAGARSWFTDWLRALRRMRAIRRQRRDLRELNDHLLKDIGLTRSEAEAEAERPLWDVPATWRR